MNTITTLTVLAILISFSISLAPTIFRIIRKRQLSYIDFALIGFFVYHVLGIVFDALGAGENQYFPSIFRANESADFWKICILIVVCPLIFRFVDFCFPPGLYLKYQDNLIEKPSNFIIFLMLALSILSIGVAYNSVKDAGSVWESRNIIGDTLGIFIIILYLPMYFFVFYTIFVKKRLLIVVAILFLLSAISALIIGQRTLAILPVVIILIFKDEIDLRRLFLGVTGILIVASVMVFYFKPARDGDITIIDQVKNTIFDDFYRTNVLLSALSASEDFGTKIMPYIGSGYVYSMLFFIPRQIVPFKGDSSASYFTSYKTGQPISSLDWGFGIGLLEELLLNFGYYFTYVYIFLYALILAILQKLTKIFPDINVPVKLSVIWAFGYNLPAVLLLFAPMAGLIMIIKWISKYKTSSRKPYFSSLGNNS